MASINLSGVLLDPTGELAVGDKIRFTHKSTTGETIQSAVSELIIGPTGAYDIDLEYGLVLIEYNDVRRRQYKNLGVATVNGTNPATSIPELLNALVPVSSAELIEFQAILADCVTAEANSEASAAAALASEANANSSAQSIDVDNLPFIFDTVALFKASLIEFPDGKTIHLNDRDADFTKITGTGTATGNRIIASTSVNQSISIVESRHQSPEASGDAGTGSASDIAALKEIVASTVRERDARSGTSIATSLTQIADSNMSDYAWPLDTTIDYQGATGEEASLINYISEPYQVLPVITDPWLASTGYSIGQKRVNGGQAYKVTVTGTSAASGGPTGTGTAIVDGTVTWESINNGLFSGVPVNERRIHAPYHPGMILDVKTPASYGGINQDAHDFMDEFEAAGGDTTGEYRSYVWAKDGATEWQFVADGNGNDDLSLHKYVGGTQLWRLHLNKANGDIQVQHKDSLPDSKPMDIAGGLRVFTDTFIDGTVRVDNKSRFATPEYSLRYRDNLGGDNEHKMSLAGANGYQWLFDAADETGLNGQAESSMRWNVYKSDGTLRSLSFSGFYGSFEPVTTNEITIGRSGKEFKRLHVTDGVTVNAQAGATGTFTTADAKTVTVVGGIITSIA